MLRFLTFLISLQILNIGCSKQLYQDSFERNFKLTQVYSEEKNLSSSIITAPPDYCNGCKDGDVILGEYLFQIEKIEKNTNRLILSGQLLDMDSKGELRGGQVFILDSNEELIESTVTNQTGRFEISSSLRKSTFLKLSMVGYRTILIDLKKILNST